MNTSPPELSRIPPILALIGALFLSLFSISCVSVKTEHRVEPIQITMDVNIRLEKELEEAFGELDARSQEIANQQAGKDSAK